MAFGSNERFCTFTFRSISSAAFLICMDLSEGSEFGRAWTVVLSAAVGVGLGITGLPIYTTGQFILPLGAAFGWSRSATSGGLIFLTIGSVVMAPIIGTLIDRFGVRRIAVTAQLGLCLGYFGLTLNGGSLIGYYVGWGILAVLGAGTSPIVWTTAVASWFERSRGLALGITLCGTGIIAVIGPGIVGGIIAGHGWKAGFYVLAASQIVIGWPLVFTLLKTREQAASCLTGPVVLPGATAAEAMISSRFWRLVIAFVLISIVIGGIIVSLPAMLADRGVALEQASLALGLLGVAIIAGRLTIGWLVDRLPARMVAPIYIVMPALSCVLLTHGSVPTLAILLIGLSSGAEVDLLAYLVSRYFGMRNYAKIYGWILSAFSAGVGVGPIFAGWIRDQTGAYAAALNTFAMMVLAAAVLIGGLGRPACWSDTPGHGASR
jgi:MFS family permease